MFLFGIVQFGMAYDAKQSINSAAREGARMAAIPDEANVTYSTIRDRVNSSFANLQSERCRFGHRSWSSRRPHRGTVLKTCTATGCTPHHHTQECLPVQWTPG